MDKIPQDIMQIADRVAGEALNVAGETAWVSVDVLALALLEVRNTERERCAVVVHGFSKINPQAKYIAEAIRKGE